MCSVVRLTRTRSFWSNLTALKYQGKSLLRATKHGLLALQKFALLMLRGNFRDSESIRSTAEERTVGITVSKK
jgi:hypothetical protein